MELFMECHALIVVNHLTNVAQKQGFNKALRAALSSLRLETLWSVRFLYVRNCFALISSCFWGDDSSESPRQIQALRDVVPRKCNAKSQSLKPSGDFVWREKGTWNPQNQWNPRFLHFWRVISHILGVLNPSFFIRFWGILGEFSKKWTPSKVFCLLFFGGTAKELFDYFSATNFDLRGIWKKWV